MVDERQQVKSGEILCQWDPHSIPILAEVDGVVRFMDIEESSREEKDGSGHVRRVIVEHKADQHPQIIIEDKEGNSFGCKRLSALTSAAGLTFTPSIFRPLR